MDDLTKPVNDHAGAESELNAGLGVVALLEKENTVMRDILRRSLLDIYGDNWRDDASAVVGLRASQRSIDYPLNMPHNYSHRR